MSGGKFWARNQARREDEPAAATPARTWMLTAVDRCDRCGAQAYVRVLLPGRLELLFCAHHGRQHAAALAKVAVGIQDETGRLALVAARPADLAGYSALLGYIWHQRRASHHPAA